MKQAIIKRLWALYLFAAIASAAALITMPASAQANKTESRTASSTSGVASLKTTVRDARASKLIGATVVDAKGEKLGKIEDFVINAEKERVAYAILSFGGFLGMGNKLFAYPVQVFRASAKGDDLVLNVSREHIRQAPGFDRNNRPDFSHDSYRTEVDRFFFKKDTARRLPDGTRLIEASELIDKEVQDRAGHEAGEIKDLVINMGTGGAYAVFDTDKAWSPRSKLIAMPLSAFQFSTRPEIDATLSVDRKSVDAAHGFEDDKWPDFKSAEYQRNIGPQLNAMRAQVRESPDMTHTGRHATGASGSSR